MPMVRTSSESLGTGTFDRPRAFVKYLAAYLVRQADIDPLPPESLFCILHVFA
jgi:hypothetical protein